MRKRVLKTFRINFPRKKHYHVYICRDKKSMYEVRWKIGKETKIGQTARNYDAITTSWELPSPDHPGCLGFILFSAKNLTFQVVAHEMFHATVMWATKLRIRLSKLGEVRTQERLAYPLGNGVNQFMRKWNTGR